MIPGQAHRACQSRLDRQQIGHHPDPDPDRQVHGTGFFRTMLPTRGAIKTIAGATPKLKLIIVERK